jgi:hypothetical protein
MKETRDVGDGAAVLDRRVELIGLLAPMDRVFCHGLCKSCEATHYLLETKTS